MREYELLKRGFLGGFTHANARYVGKVLTGVGTKDIASSYPTVMACEGFPMGTGVFIPCTGMTIRKLRNLMMDYCILCHVRLTGLMDCVGFEHILSGSKLMNDLSRDQLQLDNGRIVWCDVAEIVVTDIDLLWLTKFYTIESIEFIDMVVYPKKPLPREFIQTVLELYGQKTRLKGVEGKEVEYMVSKNMINSMYGMTVMDMIRKIVEYDTVEHVYTTVEQEEEVAISKYNDNPQRFLFYPWGVWVTAYARSNLFRAIYNLGDDYVYSDTDCAKFLHPKRHARFFERYNAHIQKKLLEVANEIQSPGQDSEDLIAPKDPKGIRHPLGVFVDEGVYAKFKTLGAKRYLVVEDGKLYLTCAGVNKQKGAQYLSKLNDPFKSFEDGLVFPAKYSGRMILSYIDDEMEGDIVDYTGKQYHYKELSGIHMEESDYTMSKSNTFFNFINHTSEMIADNWEGL